MAIPWQRYNATGNIFLVVRREEARAVLDGANLGALAQAMCDQDAGIGADGLLVISTSGRADSAENTLSVQVVNADGSDGEFSVNGLRCVGFSLCGQVEDGSIAARLSGHDYAIRMNADNSVVGVEVPAPRERRPLEVRPGIAGHYVDVGNPHFVLFRADASYEVLKRLGPTLACDASFVRGVNVSVVRRHQDREFQIWTWERGVGPTECCGSACAAAAFALGWDQSLADDAVILSEGGELFIRPSIEVRAGLHISGPVHRIDEGCWRTSTPTPPIVPS